MDKKIIIVGSSGHAKVIVDLLEILNYEIIGYIDSFAKVGSKVCNYKILGDENFLKKSKKIGTNNICIGIGNNYYRKNIFDRLQKINNNIIYPNIISPHSIVSNKTSIGIGNVIMDRAVIHSNSTIGNFNVFNTSCIVEHDCIINNFISISPGAILCGNVSIKDNVFIGAGSTIIQKKIIHENTVIGAGSVVINNCEKQSLYVGNPALKKLNNYNNTNFL
jgi:sugar O-acyltransferase (sialic acid O-acetyltransferase NeuD family)